MLHAWVHTERRKPFLHPNLGLVDEPIMEEPEEERERRDVGMKVGEAESLPYLSKPLITTVSPPCMQHNHSVIKTTNLLLVHAQLL